MTLEEKIDLWRKIKKDLLELTSSYQVFSLLKKKYGEKITLKQQGDIMMWWSKEQYSGRLKAERDKGNQLISREDIEGTEVE